MANIYKKGEKYYYRSADKLYSCYLSNGSYWPYRLGNPNYEEHTIESEVDEGKTVSYNRPQNWVRVNVTTDYNLQIVSWGDAFDNGPESTYYVTYERDSTEYVYVGGPGYFDRRGNFTTNPPACFSSFHKVGNDWVFFSSTC